MEAHTCNLSTQEVEAEKSEIWDYLGLHYEIKASLGYIRNCCLKKQNILTTIVWKQYTFRRKPNATF